MPGIYGSKIPSRWIKDAVEKKECLDILLIGDSNIGYKDLGDTHGGWTSGLSYALWNTGATKNMYGTGIIPCNSDPNIGPSYGYLYENNLAAVPYAGISGGAGSQLGGTPGGALNGWGSVPLNTAPSGVWFTAQNATRYESYLDGFTIQQSAMDVDAELRHRIVGSRFSTDGCSMTISLSYGNAPYNQLALTNATVTLTASGGSYELFTHVSTCGAGAKDPAQGTLNFRRCHPGFGAGIDGPMALLWSSVSRPGFGWSVTPFVHYGGQTLESCVNAIVNMPTLELTAYLTEVCARQIASSGRSSPRILFMLNAGANGGDSSFSNNDFTAHVNALHRRVLPIIQALGYTKDSIGYVLVPTHPMTSDDLSGNGEPAMIRTRGSAVTFASQIRSDIIACAADLAIIAPYSFIDGANYHNNPGASDREHLSQDGYLQVSSRLVTALIEYAMPSSSTVNPTSTATAYGPDTRGVGGAPNTYTFRNIGSSVAFSLPQLESYPASFAVTSSGSSAQPCGLVHVTASGTLVVSGATSNLSTTPGSNVLVPSVSSGVLTFTANSTFTARDVFVTRIA